MELTNYSQMIMSRYRSHGSGSRRSLHLLHIIRMTESQDQQKFPVDIQALEIMYVSFPSPVQTHLLVVHRDVLEDTSSSLEWTWDVAW